MYIIVRSESMHRCGHSYVMVPNQKVTVTMDVYIAKYYCHTLKNVCCMYSVWIELPYQGTTLKPKC